MTSRRSALLVPVPEAAEAVDPWLRRYTPAASHGVPAHITLLVPFAPPPAIDDALLTELRELFAAATPFQYALCGVCGFPEIVYLAPEPAAAFAELTRRIWERWPAFPPYGGVHETVIPHLTVVWTEDAEARRRATAAMLAAVPIAAEAEEVWLMDEREEGWRLRARFPLGG